MALLDSRYVAFSDDGSWWEPEALPLLHRKPVPNWPERDLRAVAVAVAPPRNG